MWDAPGSCWPFVVCVWLRSGSMGTQVIDPDARPLPGAPKVTRWSELERLAALIVEMVTATTPAGLDAYFMNREGA